jgi:phage terminase large subunit GpA-like protein
MSADLLNELKRSIADGLRDTTLTSCIRWAQRRRFMPDLVTQEVQPYTDKYHPWVREMHDSAAPFNWAMKGAQLGVTEVAINKAFYNIDKLRRDVLYVLPTAINASDFSKARFGSALALSPYLASIFTDTNTVNLKQAGSTNLYIRGSRGDSNLKSIPANVLILDEVDEMDEKQITLAIERLSGKLDKQVWGISTPTLPGKGIHKQYEETTQEHFVFKCPCCSKRTWLKWPESFEIVGEHMTDPRCVESFLKCMECGGRLEHADKPNLLKDAYWEAFDKNANPDFRGFHISQLYSFTVTPGDIAVAHFRGFGDELAAKEFHNSKLGIPFLADGAKVTEEMVELALRHHSKNDLRPAASGRIITMGVDRGRWNYVEVTEWFFERWVDDINTHAVAKVLFELKFHEEDFDRIMDELMCEWQVQACVLDADPGPMEARKFARRHHGFVWLCRYRSGVTAKEIAISDDDSGSPMATVDRAAWLSASLGRFKTNPTRILLPQDVSLEYREHMQNLASTYKRDDQGEAILDFEKMGQDHFAHARTYSEIALKLIGVRDAGIDIKSPL